MHLRTSLLTLSLAAALLAGCASGDPLPRAAGEAVLGVSAQREAIEDLPTDAPNPPGAVVQPPPADVPVPGQQVDVAPPTDAPPPGGGAPPATIEQLCARVREVVEQRGRERSLLATLDCDGGDPRANLGAFVKQVEARRGKDLPVEDADRLLALARALQGQG